MTDCRYFLSWACAGLLLVQADAIAGQTAAQKSHNRKTPIQHVSKVVTLTPKQAMAAHHEDLRALMLALYELHPEELRKSAQVGAREMTDWVFDGKFGWRFDGLHGLQDQQALALLDDPEFHGDHVLALITGLETLLFHGYGAENEFSIPPQIQNATIQALICQWTEWQQQLSRPQPSHKGIPIMHDLQALSLIQQTLLKIKDRMQSAVSGGECSQNTR